MVLAAKAEEDERKSSCDMPESNQPVVQISENIQNDRTRTHTHTHKISISINKYNFGQTLCSFAFNNSQNVNKDAYIQAIYEKLSNKR